VRSIARHLDEHDIAQEIRLERKVHKGSFLLLEGTTDIKRFDRFVDGHKCSLINCYGRDNAIGAVEILYDEGFLGAVAVVDADFDRVLGGLSDHEGLVYSEAHDLDLDWARPDVLTRYLGEYGDAIKCAAFGSSTEVANRILNGLKPISVAKLLNKRGHIPHKLKGIDVAICFGGFSVNLGAYIGAIQSRPPLTADQQRHLFAQITNANRVEYDLLQITNGHDFCSAFGVALRNDLGDRREVHTWGSEIEAHFRLALTDDEFRELSVCQGLLAWQVENAPYAVLGARFG
jgi:hypothetical protein